MRPTIKQDSIYSHFRDSILNGELKPGDRLPIREEIVESFQASSVTVQRAFERLINEGYLKSHGKRGTFVAQNLPHFSNYTIAFCRPLVKHARSQFISALEESIRRIEIEQDVSFSIYYDVDEHVQGKGMRTLAKEVEAQRLAGVIFIGRISLNPDNPILTDDRVVRIILSSFPDIPPRFHLVEIGNPALYMTKAVQHLISHGRKRIALFFDPGINDIHTEAFENALLQNGLEVEPSFIQAIYPEFPRWGSNLAQLMFKRPAAERPDGLVIYDDNLVAEVCSGLVQAGVNVPDELEVLAHTNFPLTHTYDVPVTRIGYDIPYILEHCINVVTAVRNKALVDSRSHIPPHFEWEIQQEE